MTWCRVLGTAVALLAAPVQAADIVKVGRASISLPAGAWITLARGETTAAVINDDRKLNAEMAAMALSHDGRLKAVVIVMSTPGGAGRKVDWQSSCEPSGPGVWSASPGGRNPDDRECASASAVFDSRHELDQRLPLATAMQRMNLDLPESLVMVGAFIGTRMGAVLSVDVFAADDFAGLPVTDEPAALPAAVDRQHAAFALALALRVRACAYSWSGAMALPPVNFRHAAPADRPIALSTH